MRILKALGDFLIFCLVDVFVGIVGVIFWILIPFAAGIITFKTGKNFLERERFKKKQPEKKEPEAEVAAEKKQQAKKPLSDSPLFVIERTLMNGDIVVSPLFASPDNCVAWGTRQYPEMILTLVELHEKARSQVDVSELKKVLGNSVAEIEGLH